MIWCKRKGPTRWFAWHPVPLTHEDGEYYQAWVWLQFVWRNRPSYKYAWAYALTIDKVE